MGDHGMERESRDDRLTFSLDPETLDEGSAEERAGFGTIKVVADGHCLSEGFDEHAKSYREGPLASGYHLAEWLIWNWWRLRWEPPRPPDEADAKEIESRLADAADLGEDALEEIAAGTEPHAQGSIDMLSAERIEEIAKRQGFDAKPADAVRLDSRANNIPVWGEVAAWSVGKAAASTVRRQERLGTEPIDNTRLAELAGTTARAISEHTMRSDELTFALDRNGDGTLIAFRSKWETGRRFELARLIGDRLFGGSRRLFPATQAYSYRQKAQRTFAAELLSPFEVVNEMLGDDDSDENQADIAQHYQVSPMMIRTLLVNNGRISRQDAPELLDRTHY